MVAVMFLALATATETFISGLVGALVAGVPSLILWLRERRKDRAEVKHLTTQDDLSYAELVRQLLREKSEYLDARERGLRKDTDTRH